MNRLKRNLLIFIIICLCFVALSFYFEQNEHKSGQISLIDASKRQPKLDYYLDDVIAEIKNEKVLYAQVKSVQNQYSVNEEFALFILLSDIVMESNLSNYQITPEQREYFQNISNNTNELKAKEFYFFDTEPSDSEYRTFHSTLKYADHLFQILVSSQPTAEKIMDELESDSFYSVYEKYQIDNPYSNHGYVGIINYDLLDPTFASMLSDLEYDTLDIIETDIGYMIVRKTDELTYEQFENHLKSKAKEQIQFDKEMEYKQRLIDMSAHYKTELTASFIN